MYFRIFQSGVRDCFKEYFEVYFKVNKTITDGGSTAPQNFCYQSYKRRLFKNTKGI